MATEDLDRLPDPDRDPTPGERDQRAAERDIQAAVRDLINDGQPGQDEREASARDRMEAMNDRLASARDRAAAETAEDEEAGEPADRQPGPAHTQSNGIPQSRHFRRTRRPT
jgi:hypothetical protein